VKTDLTRDFEKWYRAFHSATPENYHQVSFNATRVFHAPDVPDEAFGNLALLQKWYRSVLRCWLIDVHKPWEHWRGKLPSNDHELALLNVVSEARSTGIRRIQRRVLRDYNDVFRDFPIFSYSDLSHWCDLMFELLRDDDDRVDAERQRLTIRYDKGVEYRNEQEHQERLSSQDRWVAEMVDAFMRRLSKGKPHVVEPDDEWILVIWTGLTDFTQPVREAVVTLFVDVEKQPKKANESFLDDVVCATWNSMRSLGAVCSAEPSAATPKQVRRALDTVKLFCVDQLAAERANSHRRSARKRKRVSPTVKRQSKSKIDITSFDAFMAHNSADKKAVESIAAYLRKKGVRVWLDKEQIAPGRFFQDVLQEHLPRCRSALIFIGRAGVGRWQTVEIRTLMTRCVEQNIPILPVLLPGAEEIPSELLFLRELQWVKFRRSTNETEQLDSLIWGITGAAPNRRRQRQAKTG